MVIAKLRLPAATINAVVQFLVPPPKYHVEKLVPTAKIAPEAKLAALVVIQRGGVGDVVLERDEALEILLQNCEDAYGFPPYDEIAGFLHSRNGNGLQAVERGDHRRRARCYSSDAAQERDDGLVRPVARSDGRRSPQQREWRRGPEVERSNSTAALPIRELEGFPARRSNIAGGS